MKILRIIQYLFSKKDELIYSSNNGNYSQFVDYIKYKLIILNILDLNNSNDFPNLWNHKLDNLFGINAKIVHRDTLKIILPVIPKTYLYSFYIFDEYYHSLTKNNIIIIPVNYFFYCFWDILSSISDGNSNDIFVLIYTVLIFELSNASYYTVENSFEPIEFEIDEICRDVVFPYVYFLDRILNNLQFNFGQQHRIPQKTNLYVLLKARFKEIKQRKRFIKKVVTKYKYKYDVNNLFYNPNKILFLE